MPDVPGAGSLYALPLGDFVRARGALAKQLRSEGRREDAAAIAALRKPSAAAWALDQVAHRGGDAIKGVADLAPELRAATDAALHGDATALRDLRPRERSAVDALVAAALDAAAAGGTNPTEALRRRIADTVHAALLDPELLAGLEAGVLTDDATPAGFGFTDEQRAAAPAGVMSRAKAQAAADNERAARRRELEATAEDLERQAADAERAAARLRAKADAARAEADRAAR